MASENLVQETDGEYRHGKAVFVRGVRMPHVFAYLTGFEDFIENFQTREDDVFIVGFPRSGESVCKNGYILRKYFQQLPLSINTPVWRKGLREYRAQ